MAKEPGTGQAPADSEEVAAEPEPTAEPAADSADAALGAGTGRGRRRRFRAPLVACTAVSPRAWRIGLRAVAVISTVRPASKELDMIRLRDHFQSRVRAVVEMTATSWPAASST